MSFVQRQEDSNFNQSRDEVVKLNREMSNLSQVSQVGSDCMNQMFYKTAPVHL